MKKRSGYFLLPFACSLLLWGSAVGSLFSQDLLRVSWAYTKAAATPEGAWTVFQSSLTQNPQQIFDEISRQTDPTDLPLSFPGAASPWDSSIKLIGTEPLEGKLTLTYEVSVNDVSLANLTGEDRSLWLCNLVSEWRPLLVAYAKTRWGNPNDFVITLEQTECLPHDSVLETVVNSFRFATPMGELWYRSPWFGDFSAAYIPWIYQEKLGWVYLLPQERAQTGIYFWHPGDDAWYWSGEEVFPEALDIERERWVIFR